MSAFLKFTSTEGGDTFVRAAMVEAVTEYTEEPEATFGLHPTTAPDAESHTRIHTAEGFYKVTESARDVVAELHRSGR
jgi:hypothetical protein